MKTLSLLAISLVVVPAFAQIEVVSGGNVGIGTSSPASYAALAVNTTGSKAIHTMDSANGGLLIGYLGSSIQARTTADANSAHLALQNYGGNVGIGITTPSSQLHLYNGNPGSLSPYYTGQIRADSSGNTGVLLSTPTANAAYIYHNTPLDGASAGIKFDGNSRFMSFFTVNGTERMRIDNVGNIGIGTTSPAYKLDVIGKINGSSVTRASYFLGTGPLAEYDSSSGGLYMGFTSGGAYVRSVADNGGGAASMVLQIGNGNDAVTISAARAIRFNAYGAGSLSTDSSGNISATSDARAKDTVGDFTTGLAAVRQLQPKKYHWKKSTGLNTDDLNVSVYAQDLIAAGIPEAVATQRTEDEMETVDLTVMVDEEGREVDPKQLSSPGARAKLTAKNIRVTRPKKTATGETVTRKVDATYYSVSDRAVIAALINAAKELAAKNDALEARVAKLETMVSR